MRSYRSIDRMKGCNGRSCGCYIFPFLCAEAELLGNTFNLLDSIALLFCVLYYRGWKRGNALRMSFPSPTAPWLILRTSTIPSSQYIFVAQHPIYKDSLRLLECVIRIVLFFCNAHLIRYDHVFCGKTTLPQSNYNCQIRSIRCPINVCFICGPILDPLHY